MLDRESLKGLVGLVINTDFPTTWHFADNLCGFCTGCRGQETTETWLGRFFKEMNIDPQVGLSEKLDAIGKSFIHYSNPFVRYISAAQTDDHETPCAPWYCHKRRTGVVLFLKKRLHELLFEVVRHRAKVFCSSYPNVVNGRYYKLSELYYVDLDVWNFWDEWEQRPPAKRAVHKVKVHLEEVGNSL